MIGWAPGRGSCSGCGDSGLRVRVRRIGSRYLWVERLGFGVLGLG